MAGYALLNVEITDQTAFDEVLERAPSVVAEFGGKYLARGGTAEVLQGDWTPHRVVVIEFASAAKARAWWNSPAHEALRAMFNRCANTTMMVVEGI